MPLLVGGVSSALWPDEVRCQSPSATDMPVSGSSASRPPKPAAKRHMVCVSTITPGRWPARRRRPPQVRARLGIRMAEVSYRLRNHRGGSSPAHPARQVLPARSAAGFIYFESGCRRLGRRYGAEARSLRVAARLAGSARLWSAGSGPLQRGHRRRFRRGIGGLCAAGFRYFDGRFARFASSPPAARWRAAGERPARWAWPQRSMAGSGGLFCGAEQPRAGREVARSSWHRLFVWSALAPSSARHHP